MNFLTSKKPFAKTMLIASALTFSSLFGASSHVAAENTVAHAAQSTNTGIDVPVVQDDPYVMVEIVASKTFARMKEQQKEIAANPEILRDIMEQELMPYINYQFSAFKVLGKYTRTLERKEILEFVSVFRQYLITSYAIALGYYDDQIVEFEPARPFGDRSDVTVRAVIIDDLRPDIKLAFKVRKDKKTNQWEAYDMIAEGISLISSKQSEFEAIIRKDGIQGAIAEMRKSIEQPIELQTSASAD